jgi:hypothetical protein
MTVQTPAHRERMNLIDATELLDRSVARRTLHLRVNMYGMVEEYEVGEIVYFSPGDALACEVALPDRRKLGAFVPNLIVTTHADRSRRNSGVIRFLDIDVAVPAVNPVFSDMMGVIKGNGLINGHVLPRSDRQPYDRHRNGDPADGEYRD